VYIELFYTLLNKYNCSEILFDAGYRYFYIVIFLTYERMRNTGERVDNKHLYSSLLVDLFTCRLVDKFLTSLFYQLLGRK
jgi:hypothetical protein